MASEPNRAPGETVRHPTPDEEYFFREGCYILESWNTAGDPAVSIARARLRPGEATRPHWLDGISERYLIVAGQGRARVGHAPAAEVGAGDIVYIPAGAEQWIENIGTGDLVFYAICHPRFDPACYHETEPHA